MGSKRGAATVQASVGKSFIFREIEKTWNLIRT